MMLLCILCAIGAFALFGLSCDAHHQQRLGSRITPRRKGRMRIAAWTGVAIALPLAVRSAGWVFGPILWCGALMLGAGIVFLCLNLLPVRKGKVAR